MKKILDFILRPYRMWQEKKAHQRMIAEMRKRDPFIYK